MKRIPVRPRDAVGGEDVERLVEPRARPPDDDRVARERGERAEQHRPHRADVARRRRDPHAADDDRRRRADRRHLAAARRSRGRTRRRACTPGASSVFVNARTPRVPRREAAAAVEAEPAEPQQAGAEQHEDRVVRQERLAPVVLARADDDRGREGREARGHLDRHAAGEVERAVALRASRRPRPSARARA